MKRCVILASGPVDECETLRLLIEEDDFILCADGGLALAQRLGLKPHLAVGDFDSYHGDSLPKDIEVIKVPPEKDDTDTMLAIRLAMKRGFHHILLLGGIGGRLDHTFANIQSMAWAAEQGAVLWMADHQNEATVLTPGVHRILKRDGYKLSLFGIGEGAFGITLKGLQYPLADAALTMTTPLGVSNEWKDEIAQIELKKGMLLLVLSKD
nr:thiamine diphosphokinase [uncultured Solibaculum sp.]